MKEGRGGGDTLCTLVKMLIIMDNPLGGHSFPRIGICLGVIRFQMDRGLNRRLS